MEGMVGRGGTARWSLCVGGRRFRKEGWYLHGIYLSTMVKPAVKRIYRR